MNKFNPYFIVILVVSIFVSAGTGLMFGYLGSTKYADSSSMTGGIFGLTGTGENITVRVVENAMPSVVSIVATRDLDAVSRRSPFSIYCDDPFFRQFLGPECDLPPQNGQTDRERTEVSSGSGFFVSSEGLILTNRHVVDIGDGVDFTVVTATGEQMRANVLALDPIHDLALIEVDGRDFPYLDLGNSDQIKVGETVIAIGNALGQFSNTVSKGVISGLSRSITTTSGGQSERLDHVIQTDAAINPGNSGGPLIDLNGRVVGVNTAIAARAQNIGFAIPINRAIRDIEQFRELGKIRYPFLGVRYVSITKEIAQDEDLPVDSGALIRGDASGADVAIVPDSPADKADLMEGDIIVRVNGIEISGNSGLAEMIQDFAVGEEVTLEILRDTQRLNVTVVLDEAD